VRQIDRQGDRKTGRHRDRHASTGKQVHGQGDRETRQTEKQVDRETGELIKPCGDAAWSSVLCCDLHCYHDAITRLCRDVQYCAVVCDGTCSSTVLWITYIQFCITDFGCYAVL
jgi:hypothetical protein